MSLNLLTILGPIEMPTMDFVSSFTNVTGLFPILFPFFNSFHEGLITLFQSLLCTVGDYCLGDSRAFRYVLRLDLSVVFDE